MTALNIQALIANSPSTSGTYLFSVTRDQIIRQSMLDIGALAESEYPTFPEISDCAFKLNMLAKQWMGNTDFAPGLKVWTRKRADLFLSPTQYAYQIGQSGTANWVDSTSGLAYPQLYGQTSVTATVNAGTTVIPVASTSQINLGDYLGILIGSSIFWTTAAGKTVNSVTIPSPGLPSQVQGSAVSYVWNYTTKGVRPLTMIAVVLRDIYANDTPIRMFRTVEEYEALPNKTSSSNIGDPTAILYESQFTNQSPNGVLYLDVGGAQDVTKILHCTYLAPVQDFLNPGDAPDYPQQWYRPLVLGLAKDICGMFDCAWTQDLEDNLQASLAIAQQADPGNSSVYFEVNSDDPYGP